MLTKPDGETFEGNWLNDKKHGKAKITFSDGGTYTGDWRDGQELDYF